ncbi:serine hydrolase [Streptococcus sp. X16XC17]|uniref:serine hydrolase domain-containing protein n=1 Tax=unclassified Streptococcus TaxID=2608887 RepID=UPI00066FDDBE|nr:MULTISPECIES: serine hydrolase domain-containing protein [unclassified Streptococcus]TCD45560.1 serine hydrolase [Streptococcus sp. X16XC17]
MIQAIIDKIQEQIQENLYLGASLALFSDGKWTEYTLGHVTEEEITKPGLVYDLASVSKVVGVGTVLIFLLQSGRLDLDKTFQSYYPAFQDETVTIRDLVTHTSGIDPFIPNRDQLTQAELKVAIERITVTDDKGFQYTDINLILLGFLVEYLFGKDLDQVLEEEIFQPWQMAETSFGPVPGAVPTIKGISDGQVHDPKAKVLGPHCGSAGLFSTIHDLELFLTHYLTDAFTENLTSNISSSKPRSIVWNIDDEDWLDHTGYTGPFIMVNRKAQKAAIFLTNRTYLYDNRSLWIAKRRELRDIIKKNL